MDLNELKSAWAQYDKKLTENLNLNKELFKRMAIDKSKKELDKPLNIEIASIILTSILFSLLISFSIRIIDEIPNSMCGFILATAALIDIALMGIKIKEILKINYYTTSVVQLQQQISTLKLLVLKTRKIEFFVVCPLCLTAIPVVYRWLYGIDIFNNPSTILIIRVIVGFFIAILIVIWMYKHFYDRKIANVQHHLKEIEQFQIEE
jgi:hypothetical protein